MAALLAGLIVFAVGPAQAYDSASSALLQPDGKIAAGGSTALGSGLGKNYFALARYRQNGSLDTSFGRGGKVATPLGLHFGARINALSLRPDGKIVAAGDSYNGHNFDFALARYNKNGSLDTSFGRKGRVTTDFHAFDSGRGVVLQTDGRMVAAGVAGGDVHEGGNPVFAIARYKPNGSLDPSFGAGGTVTTPAGAGSALALQPDGKIVVGGSALVRYKPDGSLDPSFGTGGTVSTPNFQAGGIVLQPDGKIVAAGRTRTGTQDHTKLALLRYEPNGSMDASFGTGGKVATGFGAAYAEAHAVALQANGKLVVVGDSGTGRKFVLARYNSDGSLDSTFGTGGKVVTSFTVCQVPALKGKKLSAGKRAVINARCSVGKVTGTGRVVSQKPAPGTWHKVGTKVSFVLR